MPELPEVETVRRGLATFLDGARVLDVAVYHPRAVRPATESTEELGSSFTEALVGAQFFTPQRRGKFLWIPLVPNRGQPKQALLAHLGMSGQLLIHTDPNPPIHPHLRARLTLGAAGGTHTLDFRDQRMFGYLALVTLGASGVPEAIGHIALDLLDPALAAGTVGRQELVAQIVRRSSAIKAVLLNQGVVSGIGNIYADEALWAARIHPATTARALTRRQVEILLDAAETVLRAALAAGGTSFDALYLDARGEPGWFAVQLNVYARSELPCQRCGHPIAKTKLAGRGTHFCPACQPAC